jgi:RNA polymerase sigma-70 factor (ECF subfamily)
MVIGLSEPTPIDQIVERCRRGEAEGFRALYEVYKDKVYSIALYFFHGDEAAASDATQQVFLKLMRGISKFRGESGFATWLYRMVVNTCMDSVRREKPRRGSEIGAAGPFMSAAGQEDAIAQEQRAGLIQTALSDLPPKLRVAVLLRYFEDLSYEEMARAMGCSMGTVASRLNRGHKLLAKKLEGLRS